jgi:HK97 family phage major capsid protein
MASKPTTTTVDRANQLAAIQSEQSALSFYTTRDGQSIQTAREHAMVYDIGSVIRGTPGTLESGISARIAADMGMTPSFGGRWSATWVPFSALAARADLSAGTDNLGKLTIQTTVAREVGPYLRPRSTVLSSGAVLLENLRGNFTITRQSSTSTPQWFDETETAAPTNLTFAVAGTLKPHRVHVCMGYSQQILTQSSVNIHATVVNDLLDAVGTAIDYAALCGADLKDPKGLCALNTTQAITFSGTASAAKVIEMERLLGTANVRTESGVSLIASVDTKAKWRGILQEPSTSDTLWSSENGRDEVLGYQAFSTTQLASGTHANKVVLGKFSEAFVGLYGGVAILVDPYTLAGKNQVMIHCTALMDVCYRTPLAFVVSTDSGAQ